MGDREAQVGIWLSQLRARAPKSQCFVAQDRGGDPTGHNRLGGTTTKRQWRQRAHLPRGIAYSIAAVQVSVGIVRRAICVAPTAHTAIVEERAGRLAVWPAF